MTIKIGVQVEGLERAEKMVEDAVEAGKDLRPAFMAIDSHVVQPFFQRQFETSGRHGGTPWRPLAQSTIRSRFYKRAGPVALRGSRPIATRSDFPLWFTGKLKESLEGPTAETIKVIDKNKYIRGTTRRGAIAHQEGIGVPKREIVPSNLPAFLVRQIEGEVAKHIEGGG